MSTFCSLHSEVGYAHGRSVRREDERVDITAVFVLLIVVCHSHRVGIMG